MEKNGIQTRARTKNVCVWIALFLAIGTCAGAWALAIYYKQAELIVSLAGGLFTSAVVSTAFFAISTYLAKDEEKSCPSKCAKLSEVDIVDVSNIATVTKDYWMEILNDSRDANLYMMGRSLYDWVDEENSYFKSFKDAISKVVKNQNSVKILIHAPKGDEECGDETEKSLQKKVRYSVEKILGIRNGLTKNKKFKSSHFQFRHIAKDKVVPYMYIRNDRYTYISIYHIDPKTPHSKHTLIAKYGNASDTAEGYMKDFNEYFGTQTEIVQPKEKVPDNETNK